MQLRMQRLPLWSARARSVLPSAHRKPRRLRRGRSINPRQETALRCHLPSPIRSGHPHPSTLRRGAICALLAARPLAPVLRECAVPGGLVGGLWACPGQCRLRFVCVAGRVWRDVPLCPPRCSTVPPRVTFRYARPRRSAVWHVTRCVSVTCVCLSPLHVVTRPTSLQRGPIAPLFSAIAVSATRPVPLLAASPYTWGEYALSNLMY